MRRRAGGCGTGTAPGTVPGATVARFVLTAALVAWPLSSCG
ncbi:MULTISPECIES: hypothetical protein [Streptomyces]|nr:hypothetical protein [Streptomyces sp. wa1063]